MQVCNEQSTKGKWGKDCMKIIFVCTGNTCRSPMAEYLLRDYCEKNNLNFEVCSRGLACSNDRPISENSYLALKELGIDASGHKSQSFIMRDLFEADLIVTMTNAHKNLLIQHFNAGDNVKTFADVSEVRDIIDPYGCDLNYYRACRDLIAEGVKGLVSYLNLN